MASSRPTDPILTGQTTLSTTAAQITSAAGRGGQVVFQSPSTNAVNILIGSVDAQYIVLEPGQTISIVTNNINGFYAKSASATPTLNWLATGN